MSLENQLQSLVDKQALHKWIDDLPEGAQGVFIAELPSEDCEKCTTHRYAELGGLPASQALYLTRSYEHWLFSEGPADE